MTTAPTPAYSSWVLQATALELTVLVCMKPTATRTDAGKEVVEAQTADDLQQNDVCKCEVCLVSPRDTRLAMVPCGSGRSCVDQVEQQQLRWPLCRTDNQLMLRLF